MGHATATTERRSKSSGICNRPLGHRVQQQGEVARPEATVRAALAVLRHDEPAREREYRWMTDEIEF
jgi:hypothetical protein